MPLKFNTKYIHKSVHGPQSFCRSWYSLKLSRNSPHFMMKFHSHPLPLPILQYSLSVFTSNQINAIYVLTNSFSKVHFNITFKSKPYEWFPDQNFVCASNLSHTWYTHCSSHYTWFDQPGNSDLWKHITLSPYYGFISPPFTPRPPCGSNCIIIVSCVSLCGCGVR
jgi:hypothetical protein